MKIDHSLTTKLLRFLNLTSICLLVFGLVLGQLGRLTGFLRLGVYVHDIGVVIGALSLILFILSQKRSDIKKIVRHYFKPINILIMLWLIFLVLMAGLKTNSLTPLFYFCRTAAYLIVLIYLYLQNKKAKTLFPTLITAASVALIGFGLWQYLFLPDVRFLSILGFDDHYYRLIGSWFDPSVTGLIYAILSLYWINRLPGSNLRRKWYLLVPVVFSVMALTLTYSRASYLAFCVGLGILYLAKFDNILKNKKIFEFKYWLVPVLIIVTFAITLYLAPKPGGEGVKLSRTSSITRRQTSEKLLWQDLKWRDYLFGQGLFIQTGYSSSESNARLPVSWITLLITNCGVFGFLIFAYLLYSVTKRHRPSPLQVSLMVTLLTTGLINNLIIHPAAWIGLWLIFLSTTRE